MREHGSFCIDSLTKVLEAGFFEHYQDKVLIDIKNSAFNQLNHSLMDSCICGVTLMIFKDTLHSSWH